MLVQLGLTFVMTVKSMAVSDPSSAMSIVEWTGYLMLANIAAAGLMLIGVGSSLGELKRVGMSITGIVVAFVGFAVATVALVWTYNVFNQFVDILLGIDSGDSYGSLDRLEEATKDLESLKVVAIAKDIGYGLGLITVIRMVQAQAAANDQLAMRDDAGHMSRAIIVMLIGDIFYQLTYGLGGGVGLLGAVGSLLLGFYWIWCHLKLVRFFENAAHFMNEPHDIPLATVVKVPEIKDLKPKPAPRTSRPSMPRIPDAAAPPPLVIAPPVPVVPVPRAPVAPATSTTTADGEPVPGDGPKFLR